MFDMTPFERGILGTRNLFDYFDKMERSLFDGADNGITAFRTDIVDKGDKYVLRAELPGFNRDDIKVDVHEGTMTISAQTQMEKEEKEENYVRRERRFGAFSRSFDVTGIDADKIAAKYNNGILELDLPKRVEVKPEPKKISIE